MTMKWTLTCGREICFMSFLESDLFLCNFILHVTSQDLNSASKVFKHVLTLMNSADIPHPIKSVERSIRQFYGSLRVRRGTARIRSALAVTVNSKDCWKIGGKDFRDSLNASEIPCSRDDNSSSKIDFDRRRGQITLHSRPPRSHISAWCFDSERVGWRW